VALVGARLLNADGTLQEAGVIMYRDGWGVPFGRDDDPERHPYRFRRRVDAVTGACFLVRRAAFEAVGGLDDALAPAFFEEYDLAYALRARGWETVYAPACRVIHAGSATYGTEIRDRQSIRNHETFLAKWAGQLATARPGPELEWLARERPRRGGVVLVIDDRVPEHDRHAGSHFVRQQLDLLTEADCRIVYVPWDGLLRQPYARDMEDAGMEILAPDVDLESWLEEHGRHVDRVLLARPHIAERWLPSIRRRTRARVVYFTHDLHHLRERRRHATTGDPGALEESRRLETQETRVLRAVDAILTPSAAELAPIAALAPGVPAWALPPFAVPVAPSGPPLAERRAVMFLGGYEHLPNVDAAELLAGAIMPLVWASAPDVTLLLVGADPPPSVRALAGPRVEVTGHAPDLAPLYARARLTLSPLRYGAGLKGKIVSSLEAGVPVVTTPTGDEGLGLAQGTEAFIGATPDELAGHALRLLGDAHLAEAMAAAGRAWVEARFSRERARTTLHAAMDLPLPTPGPTPTPRTAGPEGSVSR
jgi:glycosyltransferase involved in cell wall biosynthesis